MQHILLLIDDDPLILKMYKKMFSFADYTVILASNGKEGLEKAEKLRPSVILLDLMMPVMDGLETLEKLKGNPTTASIPVVMLSNFSDEADMQRALEKGASNYLIKSSYDVQDLTAIIKKIVQSLP